MVYICPSKARISCCHWWLESAILDPQKTDDLFFFVGISTNRLTEFNRTNGEVNEVNEVI
jgi:hypothetical protein